MTSPIITVRPEPGCAATIEAARRIGLTVEAHPLSSTAPLSWAMPEGPFDGLLVGSANAFRCGGAGMGDLKGLPVYAVGQRTADCAAEFGFRIAATGTGGLQDLLTRLAGKRLRLLRLAGRDHVPLEAPPGIAIETVIVYRVDPGPVAGRLADGLREGAIVLLHSGAAARHFAAEVDRLAIGRSGIAIAALAPRIAIAAGSGWAQLRSARSPDDAALLALAAEMCHDLGGGRGGRQ